MTTKSGFERTLDSPISSTGARRVEDWIRLHGDLAVFVAVAAIFAIRIVAARERYLSPDEVLHVEAASAPGVAGVYENSRFLAHPPLFFLILHFWMLAGNSEFFLRVLPAVFGVGFLWSAHRWVGRLLGRSAGQTALLLVAFAPALLPLSSEVRGYSLMLFLGTAALAELEGALERRSPARMAAFSLLLSLAIVAHYAAIFITTSLFVYALIRFWKDPPPRRVLRMWVVSQALAAALYLFLYLTQVAALRGSEAMQTLTGPFASSYFHPDRETASEFLVRQAPVVFRHLFGSRLAAAVMAVLTAAGVVSLSLKRRPSAVLLAFPFVLGAAFGLMALYPFGGTRHSVYVLPFAGAAAAAAVSASGNRYRVLLSGIALLPLLWGKPDWSSPPRSLSPTKAAVDHLRSVAPRGSLLWTDSQAGLVLRYYLDPGGFGAGPTREYRLVRSAFWAPGPERLGEELKRLIRNYRLSAGKRFWMIRLGVDEGFLAELARQVPAAIFSVVGRFGDILIVEVRLRDSPAAQAGSRDAAFAAAVGPAKFPRDAPALLADEPGPP